MAVASEQPGCSYRVTRRDPAPGRLPAERAGTSPRPEHLRTDTALVHRRRVASGVQMPFASMANSRSVGRLLLWRRFSKPRLAQGGG